MHHACVHTRVCSVCVCAHGHHTCLRTMGGFSGPPVSAGRLSLVRDEFLCPPWVMAGGGADLQ